MSKAFTDLAAWLEYVDTQPWQTITMGLDRVRTVVQAMALDQPESYVITVAGTNGKGTTCIACEALLLAHGLTVGTTLSPHIDRFNERMRINGVEVDDAQLCAAFTAVDAAKGDVPLTYFEYTTAVALWLFKRHQVDVAILEIGLGGRLDSFNVIDPDCAVITSIGLDHQAFLGDDVETIGQEKAGILRPGKRAVLGAQVSRSVHQAAAELGLDAQVAEQDFSARYVDQASWQYTHGERVWSDLPVNGLPIHNLALALQAVAEVVELEPARVKQAFSGLQMRGRIEQRGFAGRQILLDVAHNPAALHFLLAELSARGVTVNHVFLGMLEDKDHVGVCQTLAELDVPVSLMDTLGYRSFAAEDLLATVKQHAPSLIERLQMKVIDVQLTDYINSATAPGDVILALGSFSVVEQMRIGSDKDIEDCSEDVDAATPKLASGGAGRE